MSSYTEDLRKYHKGVDSADVARAFRGYNRDLKQDRGEPILDGVLLMLDHTGITVTNLDRSKKFYTTALLPLSIELIMEVTADQSGAEAHAGFGAGGKAFFWIGSGVHPSGSVHVAFAATTRVSVDAFYRAALIAGGKDNGAPGLRPHYHANYYGAFVLDPDGNNIEAVCHAME